MTGYDYLRASLPQTVRTEKLDAMPNSGDDRWAAKCRCETTTAMKVFGLAGWSGSGKTTLLVHLLPELTARGLRVSTVKHAHHRFDIDQPGKDSYAHRSAGATEVMVSAANRWALMHENRGGAEPDLNELVSHMSEVDLVLVEGFKSYPHSKLEVHRTVQEKPVLCHQDPHIVAVASDMSLPGLTVPVLHLDDMPAIADFILSHCEITVPAAKGVVRP